MRVKVKGADGAVVEGDVAEVLDTTELPEGLLLESDFETRFTGELTRRAASIEKRAAKKLLADEGFKEQALSTWGINLQELAKGGEINAERLDKLREEIRKTELEPVVGERDNLKGTVDRLLARKLDADIVQAAQAVGIRKEFLRPVTDGATPMLVAALRNQFRYDPEHDDFFEVDGKGEFRYSSKPTDGRPFRGVNEALRAFAEDKANADFLDRQRSRGPNLAGGGEHRGGDVVISKADSRNHQKYVEAEELAAKQGGRLIVQD